MSGSQVVFVLALVLLITGNWTLGILLVGVAALITDIPEDPKHG